MKLAAIAVTIAVATSTVNALDRCSLRLLTSITNSDEAKKCSDESDFSFLMATVTGSKPEPQQTAAICKSTSCQAVIQKLYAAVPTDCNLLNGKNLKSLTEDVVKQCPGVSTTTALVTVPDASKTATNESAAAPATDASKPAEAPTNLTPVVVPSTPASATNASEPVPANDDSEAAPATDASKPVVAPVPATNATEPAAAPAPASDDSEELPSEKEIEEALNILGSKPTDSSEPAPAAGDSEEQPATDASAPAAGSTNSIPVIVIVDNEPSDDTEPAPVTNASQPAPATVGSQ